MSTLFEVRAFAKETTILAEVQYNYTLDDKEIEFEINELFLKIPHAFCIVVYVEMQIHSIHVSKWVWDE